ncbi:MAG: L-serine ammonia-lyase, iron-sulfur-dependent, subunit alpha, partial [Tidjanibacter sp.]|nr:L-serine ammonia-lyase, iron-sulfur-dependent, subunit alpha [Tidjanibacter sp.]
MRSIKEIFIIGKGPSSSHTMGPKKASIKIRDEYPNAAAYRVTLYGSLAATVKGHLTDMAINEVFEGVAPVEIVWCAQQYLPYHPNAMKFEMLDAEGNVTDSQVIYSIGGGTIVLEGEENNASDHIYPMTTMNEIMAWCNKTGKSYWEFVFENEGEEIKDYLLEVWRTMRTAIENGLANEGVLPGALHLRRKAASYHVRSRGYNGILRTRGMLFSYALAVSEENASGGTIVTAPTCGSCGIVPAVLYHLQKEYDFKDA